MPWLDLRWMWPVPLAVWHNSYICLIEGLLDHILQYYPLSRPIWAPSGDSIVSTHSSGAIPSLTGVVTTHGEPSTTVIGGAMADPGSHQCLTYMVNPGSNQGFPFMVYRIQYLHGIKGHPQYRQPVQLGVPLHGFVA